MLCASLARAESAPTQNSDADRTFAGALQEHLQATRFDDALVLLESRPDLASDPAAVRLRAELLYQLGRTDEAQALLEARLYLEPDDALARFQLGELNFSLKRDAAAQLAYRLALAGNLDQPRRTIVNTRLAQLRERRDWRFSLGASITPDSNLNSGASVAKVDIFGLPFDLDEAARQKSGLALAANASIERRFVLGPRTRLTAVASGWITRASSDLADTEILSLRTGVESLAAKGVNLSLEPGMDWVRQADRLTQTSTNLTVSLEAPLGPRTFVDGALRAGQIDDRISDSRDGWSYQLYGGQTRYLTPSSLLQFSGSVERRLVQADSESYLYVRMAQGWLAPLPYSASAYVEPYVGLRHHDADNAFFGVARKDREYGLGLRLSKRDWVWRGAFPYISISLGQNRSNIALYTYTRRRVEFGLTRQF